MKTITVNYNLQNITQKPEAHLSDLFILLYTIYLIRKQGVIPTRYSLNKIFPYIFDKLENEGKLEKLTIFNLPFYKMQWGHYNKSLTQKYLKSLQQVGLVDVSDKAYQLTRRATQLVKEYFETERKDATSKEFENLVEEFVKKYLKDSAYYAIYESLKVVSHTMLVEDEGTKKRVHDLDTDDSKAISYNHEDFKEGKVSNLVPEPYLILLAHEMQSSQKITQEDLEQVDTLLSKFA